MNDDNNRIAEAVADLKGVPTQDELLELLRSNIVEITFKKLDGNVRVMPCTLIESYLPERKTTTVESSSDKAKSNSTIAVWATESKAFRSFRYDRIISVNVLEQEKSND